MQVMSPISLHRIFSLHESDTNHIECINQIYSQNAHRSCNLSSNNDCASCQYESKHDSSRISDESRSLHIQASHKKSGRNDYCHECEEKLGILLDDRILIDKIELEGKSCHDDGAHERKTPCKSGDTI